MLEKLLNLVNTIRDRKDKDKDKDKSYTSSLLSGGLSKYIDKMEEEFDELKEALNDKSNIYSCGIITKKINQKTIATRKNRATLFPFF